jgi:hypothetical protein
MDNGQVSNGAIFRSEAIRIHGCNLNRVFCRWRAQESRPVSTSHRKTRSNPGILGDQFDKRPLNIGEPAR